MIMSDSKSLMRDLHRLHQRAQGLREEAELGPRRLRAQQAKADQQQLTLKNALEEIKHLKVAIHDKEVTLKATQIQLKKHRQQLNSAGSKKEYDALEREIDAETQTIRLLEDDILVSMGTLEDKQGRIPSLEEAVRQAQEGVRTVHGELGTKQIELDQRSGEARTALEAAEADLAPDARSLYDRLVQAHGSDALAPLSGRSCTGCYTDITPQAYTAVISGRVVTCKSCGRLLYPAD